MLTQPDNTKQNQRDRAKSEKTADRGSNAQNDRETMQKIRKSIVDDNSLSTYAHNVKIIAKNGKVTLKGPVRPEEEKRTVEQKATEVAGSGNATNELTIKPRRPRVETKAPEGAATGATAGALVGGALGLPVSARWQFRAWARLLRRARLRVRSPA